MGITTMVAIIICRRCRCLRCRLPRRCRRRRHHHRRKWLVKPTTPKICRLTQRQSRRRLPSFPLSHSLTLSLCLSPFFVCLFCSATIMAMTITPMPGSTAKYEGKVMKILRQRQRPLAGLCLAWPGLAVLATPLCVIVAR